MARFVRFLIALVAIFSGFGIVSEAKAQISVSESNNPVSANIIAGSDNVPVLNLRFVSENARSQILNLRISQIADQVNNRSVDRVTIAYRNEAGQTVTAAVELDAGQAFFSIAGNPAFISANSAASINVYADIRPMGHNNDEAKTGDQLQFSFSVNEGFRARFGEQEVESCEGGDVVGNLMVVRKSIPTFSRIQLQDPVLRNGQQNNLYSFRVSASEAGSISIATVLLEMRLAGPYLGRDQLMALSDFSLTEDGNVLSRGRDYEFIGYADNNELEAIQRLEVNRESRYFYPLIRFNRERIISAGQSKVYTLRAVANNLVGRGEYQVTTLLRNPNDERPFTGRVDMRGSDDEPYIEDENHWVGSWGSYVWSDMSGTNGDNEHNQYPFGENGEASLDWTNGWNLQTTGAETFQAVYCQNDGGQGERGYIELYDYNLYQDYLNPHQQREVIRFSGQSNHQYQIRSFDLEIHRPWGAEDLDTEDSVCADENLIYNIFLGREDGMGYNRWTELYGIEGFENIDGPNSGVKLRINSLDPDELFGSNRSDWFVSAVFHQDIPIGAYQFVIHFDGQSIYDLDNHEWLQDIYQYRREDGKIEGPVLNVVENTLSMTGNTFTSESNLVKIGLTCGTEVGGLQFDLRVSPNLQRLPIIFEPTEGFQVETAVLDSDLVRVMMFSESMARIEPCDRTILTMQVDGSHLEPQELVSFEPSDWRLYSFFNQERIPCEFRGTQMVRGMLGDANMDWSVDVADVITAVRASHWRIWDDFVLWAVDYNNDDRNDITDVMLIVEVALHEGHQGVPQPGPFYDHAINRDDPDEWQWGISNERPIRGLQIDLYGDLQNQEATLNPDRCQGMTLTQSWIDTLGVRCLRITIWSMRNVIQPGNGPLIIIPNVEGMVRSAEPIIVFGEANQADDQLEAPKEFQLKSAYPNPFNSTTRISFDLPHAGLARMAVYDLSGRETAKLIDSQVPAGSHSITFNAAGLATGTYFLRLESQQGIRTQKIVLVK